MGDPTAREIEEKLSLDIGWMDTPPSYAELHGEEDPRTKVMKMMENMSVADLYTTVRLVDALAKPTKATPPANIPKPIERRDQRPPQDRPQPK